MFVLGQIVATQKAIVARQDIANGCTGKLEGRIETTKKWIASQDGKNKGFSTLWLTIFNVITLSLR
jgi:hypothetical protein